MKECQKWVDSKEFAEWMAFDRLSPIDGRRDDYNAAMIAATIAACFGGKNETLEKHLLEWGKSARPGPLELEEKMMAFARKHNARLKKRGV